LTGNVYSQLPLAEPGKPISTCSAPLVQTGERKTILTIWPWPLTYDIDL